MQTRNRIFGSSSPLHIAGADNPIPAEILWMPQGRADIAASKADGTPWSGSVVCDAAGFAEVLSDFTEARANGKRVWLDENHENSKAVADITGCRWDPAIGIIATVQWTPYGENLLREKQYTSFSPSFFTERASGRIAGLVTGHASGGLTNAPAFGSAMPAVMPLAARASTMQEASELGAMVVDGLSSSPSENRCRDVTKVLLESNLSTDLLVEAGVAVAADQQEFLRTLGSLIESGTVDSRLVAAAALVAEAVGQSSRSPDDSCQPTETEPGDEVDDDLQADDSTCDDFPEATNLHSLVEP